jgi:3-oxoacyl-[acyl-carrier-protein] synthase II
MPEKRVVITGLGIISPIGIGREGFCRRLLDGACGIKPISFFDTSIYKTKTAGEISDFAPENFLGAKGLRTLDRSTKLVICATKLALEDAGLEVSDGNSRDIGIAVGSTMGSIKSISDFDKDALLEGPRYVNPALFPNTVINSPASQISIRFAVRGFNATISNGYSASLDALNYAADFLRLGRIKAVLAGGVEELCEQTFAGFYHAGCLAAAKEGSIELSCPFDKRRSGAILGEGSTMLIIEELVGAKKRGVRILGEVKGYATAFGKEAQEKVMRQAIERSGLNLQDIDCILASANSSVEGDRFEAEAIKDVFAKDAQNVYISAVKSMVGEQYSNSGATAMAVALCAIEKGVIPPTVNYQEKDPSCEVRVVVRPKQAKVRNVLINAFGKTGSSSSMVISEFKE